MYGVSPQPAQAPENSISGCRNCEPFTSRRSVVRSTSGRPRKKSNALLSCSRSGGWGESSRALCLGLALSFAGQTSTHRPQPVQSSGATWTVYALPGWPLKAMCLKPCGAVATAPSP